MPNLPNPSKAPEAQSHSDKYTGETIPEGGVVTCEKCFRALLVFVLRFVRDVGRDHGYQAQTNGFADLPCVSTWVCCGVLAGCFWNFHLPAKRC